MEITIEKQAETPLLLRKRVTAMVAFEGATPSRIKMRDMLAKKAAADPDKVIIKHVYQHFGKNKARIIANVYKERTILEKLEHAKLVKKHTTKEEAEKEMKKEETPSETKEEKIAEALQEEKAEETKKKEEEEVPKVKTEEKNE